MRALYYDGQLRLIDTPKPHLEGEALVRVVLAGICNTDIEITRGYAGFKGIPGHEFVGVVERASNRDLVGRRVVGEINAGCGYCSKCLAGDPRHCPQRTVLGISGRDGAFAEYLSLPEVNLKPVPEGVSNLTAVFTEPVAAACSILERVELRPEDRVLVIGDGKLGLLIAQVLRSVPCRLLLAGKHQNKLNTAVKCGIDTVLVDDLKEREFDFIVEASGSESGIKLAIERVRPRGSIVLKSTFAGAVTLDMSELVVKEVAVIGSRCGRFEDALRLMEAGKLDLSGLVSEVLPLERGVDGFALAVTPGVIKVLLEP